MEQGGLCDRRAAALGFCVHLDRLRFMRSNVMRNYRGRQLSGDALSEQSDYNSDVDIIRDNAVTHGHCTRPVDRQYSSIYRVIGQRVLRRDWGTGALVPGDLGVE